MIHKIEFNKITKNLGQKIYLYYIYSSIFFQALTLDR